MTTEEKLHKLIDEADHKCRPGTVGGITHTRYLAHLKKIIEEDIIGEDELVAEKGGQILGANSNKRRNARNQLRKLQRERLGIK